MVNLFRIDLIVTALRAEMAYPSSDWKFLTKSERLIEGFQAFGLLLSCFTSLFGIWGLLNAVEILARLVFAGYVSWWNILPSIVGLVMLCLLPGAAVFFGGLAFLTGQFAFTGKMPRSFGQHMFKNK